MNDEELRMECLRLAAEMMKSGGVYSSEALVEYAAKLYKYVSRDSGNAD